MAGQYCHGCRIHNARRDVIVMTVGRTVPLTRTEIGVVLATVTGALESASAGKRRDTKVAS
jgi:hypothetical protein